MARTGLTAKVREAAVRLKQFTAKDIGYLVGVSDTLSRKRVRQSICGLLKAGEIIQTDQGKYEYRGRTRPRTKTDVIWHLIRSHRAFTSDEIERLSGATRRRVLDYLRCLKRIGLIREMKKDCWRLVKDTGPATPVGSQKCKKLKTTKSKMEEK